MSKHKVVKNDLQPKSSHQLLPKCWINRQNDGSAARRTTTLPHELKAGFAFFSLSTPIIQLTI